MSDPAATTRYPGYDVLNKRQSPSWDAITRRVVDERLGMSRQPRFFAPAQWQTVVALSDRIVVQPADREPVPIASMLDGKLHADEGDGWRNARLPSLREAWRIGLAALDAETLAKHRCAFALASQALQLRLIEQMQHGELHDEAWSGMPCDLFFSDRVLHDLCSAYYSHPSAWSEIGFGGPANPRGYVRLYKDRRDSWEAVEAGADNREAVRRENRRVR